MTDHLLIADGEREEWRVDVVLRDQSPQSLALDPFNETRVYCGTSGSGLWISDDLGRSWRPSGRDVFPTNVTAVAVSSIEKTRRRFGLVYVGSEPSEVFRSEDGGDTWKKPAEINELPSSASWSFPPRPDTHHVRYISTDPSRSGSLYAAIEAGALIRSFDGGKTWKDRVSGGPYDTHTLETSVKVPGRLYSAAGDGYFESRDYGETWSSPEQGLRHRYLYSVSVNQSDPETILVSASSGPFVAYNYRNAASYVYRKKGRDERWQSTTEGLPEPEGTTISALAADNTIDAGFYAANNMGVFWTRNAGTSWRRLKIPWSPSNGEQQVRALRTVGDN
jgi:photosystem II stability/assembly factor-like uncharacterized protein